MLDWIRDILSEKSTYAGIFLMLTAFNVHSFTPEQETAIACFGAVLVARHEKKNI